MLLLPALTLLLASPNLPPASMASHGSHVTLVVKGPEGMPLEGATVTTSRGTAFTTNRDGEADLGPLPQGRQRLQVQASGCEGASILVTGGAAGGRYTLRLRRSAGAVVEVLAEQSPSVRTSQLRTDIVATEVVSSLDLEKLNAISLNEAIDFRPGVAVQTECSICNVRTVVLNNLPGRFTTTMIDGIPIFSSLSGAYGMDMIGVAGVDSIDVSRGAGVSLVAPEALSGTVNVVSRRPTRAEVSLEPQGGNGGQRRMEAFLAQPVGKGAFTASLTHARHEGLDGNGNGVTEFAAYDRTLGGVGFFHDGLAGWQLRGRLDGVRETRHGGALGEDLGAIRSDRSGAPFDFRGGVNGSPFRDGWVRAEDGGRVVYDGGRGGISEVIETRRQQGLLVAERDVVPGHRLKVALGVARHDQDSFYGGDLYRAVQDQTYAEASLQSLLGETLLTLGLNHRYESLRSEGALGDGTPVKGLDDYTYRTPAAFLQAYRAFLDGRVEVNVSCRYDHNNVFGGLASPRGNVLLHHAPGLTSRLALGRGFRVPTSFFEQDHGILATTRIERRIDRPETSDNASYTFNWATEGRALTLGASWTRIRNFALLDSGAQDAAGQPITVFTQAANPVTVKGLDGTFTQKLGGGFEGTLGAETYRYTFDPGVLSVARPEARIYLRLDHEATWGDTYLRGTWTGPMDLARFYVTASEPRYNLNGTPKLQRSPGWWSVDLGGRVRLGKQWSLVASVSNLLDFQQTDREDFLWVNRQGELDVTQIWGPGRGRSVQVGVRWRK